MKTKINVIILILAAALCLIACVEEEISTKRAFRPYDNP